MRFRPLTFRSPSRTRTILALLLGLSIAGLSLLATGRDRNPDRVWAQGHESLQAERIADARAAVTRLARLRDPTPMDWMLRARVDIAEGHTDAALAALSNVPDGHAMAPQARLMAGQLELRRHRARIAEAWLREGIRLDPGLAQARRELIYIYGYHLRRAELDEQFDALSRMSELSFDNVFHWGLLHTAQWDPASAIEELRRFIEADPEDRWSRLALAENYRRSGLYAEAEALLTPLPDDDPEALVIRVMLLMDRRQEDEAERLLESAPADSAALNRLRGRVALAHRDGSAAARYFRLAEAREPGHRDAVFGLINALTLLGDDQAAAPLRDRAKQIDRLNGLMERAAAPASRTNLGLLRDLGSGCAALGRVQEARAWYRLALAVEPLDSESQQALFRLRADAAEPSPSPSGATIPG